MFRRWIKILSLENEFNWYNERIGNAQNHSRFLSKDEQQNFRDRVINKYQKPFLITRYVNFIRFEDDQHPIYFNVMREPFQRFRSRFNFGRSSPQWPKFHFKYSLQNFDPLAVANQTFNEWKFKTLEDCILNDEDQECNMKIGDKVENQMAYFCGQDYECSLHGSTKALSMAKMNVEKHYPVVGILERLQDSLILMEKTLPEFFNGLTLAYNGETFNDTSELQEVKKEAIIKMKNNLALEYEFYNFLNRRLSQQAFNMIKSHPNKA